MKKACGISLTMLALTLTACAGATHGATISHQKQAVAGTSLAVPRSSEVLRAKTPTGPAKPASVREVSARQDGALFLPHASVLSLVRDADIIFVGTVTGERRGPVSSAGGPDELSQRRLLDISSERTLMGPVSPNYEVSTVGWVIAKQRDGSAVEWRESFDNAVDVKVGDRAIFILKAGSTQGYEFPGNDGVFLLRQGHVTSTTRVGTLIHRLEAMNESDAINELRTAAS